MASYTALYDACVLYPAPLRDLLMHLAMTHLFRARWTDRIHDEWIRNLLKNRTDLAPERLAVTRQRMNNAVPDCLVTNYEELIDGLKLPDPDDRHVLAAAIASGADVIVSYNLKHFPADALAPWNIEAQHPDDFIACQFDLNPPLVTSEVRSMRAGLKSPPQSVEQFLQTLANQQLPQTVERLREYAHVI